MAVAGVRAIAVIINLGGSLWGFQMSILIGRKVTEVEALLLTPMQEIGGGGTEGLGCNSSQRHGSIPLHKRLITDSNSRANQDLKRIPRQRFGLQIMMCTIEQINQFAINAIFVCHYVQISEKSGPTFYIKSSIILDSKIVPNFSLKKCF